MSESTFRPLKRICEDAHMSESPLVLVSASATGVLGEHHHKFEIGPQNDFVIIYGPNGVGKTKFLEIIHHLSHLRGFRLSRLPFDRAVLRYSDGSELSARRTIGPNKSNDPKFTANLVTFTLKRPKLKLVTWVSGGDDLVEMLRVGSPYEQITDELWQDPSDGEVVHIRELRARYSARSRASNLEQVEAPSDLREFVKLVPSFLIETQRLRTEEMQRQVASTRFGTPRESRKTRSRITEQAENIRSLLNDAQTEHSRITQRLDRTFPNRVLNAARQEKNLDARSIRERYDDQNVFRSRLGRVASVSLSEELSLPDGQLEAWALALLDLYLEDAKAKLAPFVDLLERIELLEQIVNDRLLNKKLAVTDQYGLSVAHSGAGRTIELDSLSSGEQHEIILMIDLLFHVPSGAVVLIDEPEISLHVAWQLAFLPDVKRIAELVGFHFVVATHSPQIINGEWERAERLGPAEVSFQ